MRKLKQGFEQRKRNLCCKMATTIPYAYLSRKTLGRGAARRPHCGGRPRSGRPNDWRGADRDVEMAGAMPAWVGVPKLFAFTRVPKSQWKSIRASNAIVLPPERLPYTWNHIIRDML